MQTRCNGGLNSLTDERFVSDGLALGEARADFGERPGERLGDSLGERLGDAPMGQ
jgi:hypothetical protein